MGQEERIIALPMPLILGIIVSCHYGSLVLDRDLLSSCMCRMCSGSDAIYLWKLDKNPCFMGVAI